jgi:hypothetical protein
MIAIDKSIWTVISQPEATDCYLIENEQNEQIASYLTLAVAVQIVDEHSLINRFIALLGERKDARITLDRAPL